MKKNNDTKRLLRTIGISEQRTLLCKQKKTVNQSSDFPVCRTSSYRHKKSTDYKTSQK